MRLDVFLVENGYVCSRTEAKGFISEGAVKIDGRIVTKPAFDVSGSNNIEIDKSSKKYV
jgi:23S rRNA (cytidine1920-2'-O)/16S rRNA (cytidine1409-2'-O)-methyltransferase